MPDARYAFECQRRMGFIVGRIQRHVANRREMIESQQAGNDSREGGEGGATIMRQMSVYVPRKRGEWVRPRPPRPCCRRSVHTTTTPPASAGDATRGWCETTRPEKGLFVPSGGRGGGGGGGWLSREGRGAGWVIAHVQLTARSARPATVRRLQHNDGPVRVLLGVRHPVPVSDL